MRNCAA